MMRKRRTRTTSPIPKCCIFRATLIVVLTTTILPIPDCQADFLMGGHLDNKDNRQSSTTDRLIDATIDPDRSKNSASTSSRSASNYDDLDFDLGLDLIAEPSESHDSRIPTSDSTEEIGNTDDGEKSAIVARYRVPLAPYAFNGGQPFSLEKDPITGQIDFEKAPPLKVLDYSSKTSENTSINDFESSDEDGKTSNDDDSKMQSDEGVGPNEINPYSPNLHDFLNLPVRYTYDNTDKYPLISNSYANTKVQSGGNSYNTYNHKKYHEIVKSNVNAYLQPSRKTHVQSVTKKSVTTSSGKIDDDSTTSRPITSKPTTTTTTATTTTSTTMKPTTARPTTTTSAIVKTTKIEPETHEATTWKPHSVNDNDKYSEDDYEATLPIERLQPISHENRQSTTLPSRYASPPPRPSKPVKIDAPKDDVNDEYEEGYDEYEHIFSTGLKPSNPNDRNDSDNDYSYGMDLFGLGSPTTSKPLETTTIEQKSVSTISTTSTSIVTTADFIELPSSTDNNRDGQNDRTTTPRSVEEKRVTSMPLDTNDPYIGNYPNNGQFPGTIDNTIPSVTSNVGYHQIRPTSNDRYYGRPSMMMPSPGIVVKSTSNVVVPPGQDTVSFVLGNRQSVGSVGDNSNDYYPVHSGSMNDRTGVSFGKVVDTVTMNNPDSYPGGHMIVSAGIGVGSNSGGSYVQRPQSNSPYDHALVSVGMPTVDVVNPADGGQSLTNNNPESSTPISMNSVGPQWWSSTGNPNVQKPQQNQHHESVPSTNNQFGYRVVFPDDTTSDKNPGSNSGDKTSSNVDEHVIVVHETEIGPGNTLHLELPSQSSSTSNSLTPGSHHDTTTQRFTPKPDDQGLPELSESLTPPAEHPNRVQQQLHRPSNYNYYHHQSHSNPNSRPNDYPRPQRLPLPPLPPSSPTSSSNANGFKRRPSLSLDSNLPNILPQFRPNAKVSQGHNRGDNVGTLPAGSMGHYPNPLIRRPPPHYHQQHHHHHNRPTSSRRPVGPPHLQRLNPPPVQALSPPITSLRLPTPAALVGQPPGSSAQQDTSIQANDNPPRPTIQKRIHQVSVGVPPALNIDERHQGSSFGSQQAQPMKSRLEDDNPERFSAESPQQPPRAPFFGKRGAMIGNDEIPEGMPVVATLQMIKQHGGDDSIVKAKLPPPYRFNVDERPNNRPGNDDSKDSESNSSPNDNRRGDEPHKGASLVLALGEDTRADYVVADDSPVYVVYPVKGAMDIRPTSHEDNDDENDSGEATVVLGKYGPQRPLPPDTLLKNSNDDATTDHRQSYRPPSASFIASSSPILASDFPYHLERPDPSFLTSTLREKPLLVPSEQRKNVRNKDKTDDKAGPDNNEDNERDSSVNVIPHPQDHVVFGSAEQTGPISATLHRFAAPSSIMDSSSTPIAWVYTPTMRPPIRRQDDGYGHSNFERTPVLLQSQHATSTSSGPASPQSFMAPFVASANAEAPSKNGWSVVKVEKSAGDNSQTENRRRSDIDLPTDDNEETKNVDKVENDDTDRGKIDETKNSTKTNADADAKNDKMADEETIGEETTFNLDSFTPQLFGGFKPIYEFLSDSETDPTLGDKVTGGAPAIERPRSGTESAKIEARKMKDV